MVGLAYCNYNAVTERLYKSKENGKLQIICTDITYDSIVLYSNATGDLAYFMQIFQRFAFHGKMYALGNSVCALFL